MADITAISFSADSPVTTITTTTTIANLSSTPAPGNGVTLYRVAWLAPDGKTYATEAQVSPGNNVVYGWGGYDPIGNSFVNGTTSTTGTFNPGMNGTITVDVPASSVGQPTIPVYDDTSDTPAVRNPYGIVYAGEGAAGAVGATWVQPMDRAPDSDGGVNRSGYGQSWSVCTRPNNPPVAVLSVNPTVGTDGFTATLDGSQSYDPDAPFDTVASHTFSFGDGSTSVTQSTPQITHAYYHNQACGSQPCTYVASLTVTDSRGMQSVNSAQEVITANPARRRLLHQRLRQRLLQDPRLLQNRLRHQRRSLSLKAINPSVAILFGV